MVAIIPRAEWGARAPKRDPHDIDTTPRLWLHHTAGWPSSITGTAGYLRNIQRFHQDTKGWNDIAYNLLTSDDGKAWEGRGPLIAGGHTAGDNTRSHAICAIGDYTTRAPSDAMLDTIAQLVAHGHRQQWWSTRAITGGHRSAPKASTACPGDRLNAAIEEINAEAARILTGERPAPVAGLRTGDKGPGVEFLQAMLNIVWRLRINANGKPGGRQITVDGHYGPETRAAVAEFQRFADAMRQIAGSGRVDIDGIAGPDTLGALAFWVPIALETP